MMVIKELCGRATVHIEDGCLRDLVARYALSFALHALDSSILLVDYVVLGRTGKGHLAAAFVGFSVFNLVWYFCEGILSTFDALDYKDKKSSTKTRLMHAGVLVVVVCSSIGTLTFFLTHQFLHPALEIPLHVAVKANQHLVLLTPSLWLLGIQKIATKQLIYNGYSRPLVEALSVGAASNAILVIILVRVLGLGFIGCAISTDIARLLVLATLYFRIRALHLRNNIVTEVQSDLKEIAHDIRSRINKILKNDKTESLDQKLKSSSKYKNKPAHNDAAIKSNVNDLDADGLEMINLIEHAENQANVDDYSSSDSEIHRGDNFAPALRKKSISQTEGTCNALFVKYGKAVKTTLKYAVVGIPSGVGLLLEYAIGSITCLTIARWGSVPINVAMISFTTVHSLSMSLAFPLASASTLILSKYIQEDDVYRCRSFSRAIVVLAFLIALLSSYFSFIFFRYLSFITTDDVDTVNRIIELSKYMIAYSFVNSLQLGVRGVLKVVNYSREVYLFIFLSIWICGYLTSCYLAFIARPTYELRGYYIGLLLGGSLLAASFVLMVIFIDWEVEISRHSYLQKRGDYKRAADNPLSSLEATLDGHSLGHVSLVAKGYRDLDDELDVLRNTEFKIRELQELGSEGFEEEEEALVGEGGGDE